MFYVKIFKSKLPKSLKIVPGKRFVRMNRRMRGHGHVVQRLCRGFGLPVSEQPKGELYLTEEERLWACDQRAKLGADKPVCIISTRAITDASRFRFFHWEALAETLSESYTLVHPVLTCPQQYTKDVPAVARLQSQWENESILPNAIVYRDLPVRRYIALFSAADLFCGPTSGGTHIAAAFNLPAFVILWEKLADSLSFPCQDQNICTESFLYPQHKFLATDNLNQATVEAVLRQLVKNTCGLA